MAEVVTTKPRILVVCQHYWPESFRINDIADFFVEKGCEVDVLCGLPNYPQGTLHKGYSFFRKRRQLHNGAHVHRVPEITRGNNTNARILLNYLSFPFFSLFYIPWLLTKNYDKIFLYQLSPVMMSIAGIVVGKIRKIETTMYVLDLWPENLFSVLDIQNPILRRIVTHVSHWHYQRVDKLIVLSEQMKQRLSSITNISPSRITVIPQASEKIYEVDTSDETLNTKYGKGFNILYAGNISPAQSFGTMIEAAQLLKASGKHDIKWIIVGDGMSKKQMEEDVAAAQLSESFNFEGHKPITEISNYTHVADVLVGCLAKSELLEATIPAKVMSYIASGKPIVLAMDGEVAHLINDTIQCGFVGPTEDATSLAANIAKIYDMPVRERNRLGERARSYHFAHFERNILLNKLYEFVIA